jgi:hypothetical protein
MFHFNSTTHLDPSKSLIDSDDSFFAMFQMLRFGVIDCYGPYQCQ